MPQKLNASVIKQAREGLKLSLSEVANFTRISDKSIRRFEKLAGGTPAFRQLSQLAALYNTPIYVFYGTGIFPA